MNTNYTHHKKTYQNIFKKIFLFLLISTSITASAKTTSSDIIASARAVVERVYNKEIASKVDFEVFNTNVKNPTYEYEAVNGTLKVKGNSTVALCHGFYSYIKATNQGMVTWSGTRNNITFPWKSVPKTKVVSPFQYHYYMNVVTHGYSTAYWDYQRWEQELDWMALHGMDLLLVNGAFEAIMYKTFVKYGMSPKDALDYFTGPAQFPWNRMGNVIGWDSPFPADYLDKQLKLAHQVKKQMDELGMTPIIQCFAGFVPETIVKTSPDIKIKKVNWVSFDKKYTSNILLPNTKEFLDIGALFIKEYEKEFGKGKFYLADNFNEMDVPRAKEETEETLINNLANYGNSVYQSIKKANKNAIWVMQGWTFPYHQKFWTYERLNALVSKVPDDKLLFLDLANEYNHDRWKIPPSWKTYKGFFNKMWVYSFIPNMGGKTAWNGILETYVNGPSEALQYEHKGKLVGYGFAPEGIENNDLIYELISDLGYTDQKINLDNYIANYCENKYGGYPQNMKLAFDYFRKSCYGTFTDHPRFSFQLNYKGTGRTSLNADSNFREGVRLFLSCKDELKTSSLYQADAIELTVQYTGYFADKLFKEANVGKEVDDEKMKKSITILEQIDTLLLSHPTQRLERWVQWARNWGNTEAEKDYYESNAKRLVTTWGGGLDDYSARMWSGLIDKYYLVRMKAYVEGRKENKPFDAKVWSEQWIKTPYVQDKQPYKKPLYEAQKMVNSLN